MSIEDDYPDTRATNRVQECPHCHGTGVRGDTEWGRFDARGRYPSTLETPCDVCGAWRIYRAANGDAWFECWFCGDTQPFEWKEKVLEYLSDETGYAPRSGKPGVLMGECPCCHTPRSVNGGPDGELYCDECGDFYAGRYSTEWWLYGAHMIRYDTGIRVEVTTRD